MVFGNTKRIVVIKDIPSNIIEEAIFILKSEPGNNNEEKKSKATTAFYNKFGKDYLIKEAESVINNYITENKTNGIVSPGVHLKINSSKKKFLTNTTINVALVCSIAILIFVLSRFI